MIEVGEIRVNIAGEDKQADDVNQLCGLSGFYFLTQLSDMWLRKEEGKPATTEIYMVTVEGEKGEIQGYMIQKGYIEMDKATGGSSKIKRTRLGVPNGLILALKKENSRVGDMVLEGEGVDLIVRPNREGFVRGRSIDSYFDFERLDTYVDPLTRDRYDESGNVLNKDMYVTAAYERLQEARKKLSDNGNLLGYEEMYDILKQELIYDHLAKEGE